MPLVWFFAQTPGIRQRSWLCLEVSLPARKAFAHGPLEKLFSSTCFVQFPSFSNCCHSTPSAGSLCFLSETLGDEEVESRTLSPEERSHKQWVSFLKQQLSPATAHYVPSPKTSSNYFQQQKEEKEGNVDAEDDIEDNTLALSQMTASLSKQAGCGLHG